MRRCPACRSNDVRRSRVRASESDAHALRSPYRCKSCNTRFWVVSRKARIGAVAAGVCVLTVTVVVAVATLMPYGSLRGESAAGISAWEDDPGIVTGPAGASHGSI